MFDSKNTFVVLDWFTIEEENNGGSEILGYEIYVEHDSDQTQTFTMTPTDTQYTVTGLTGGETYKFSIAGYNKYGVGTVYPIPTLEVVAAQQPDAVSQVTVVISGNYALITWDEPFANFSPVTGYYVYIENNWDNGM